MDTIKQPMFRYYRNSEFLQYMKDVLAIVNSVDVLSLQLTEQVQLLTMHTNKLLEVFEQEKQQKITEALLVLDAKRDSLFIGIKRLLEGNTHHFDFIKQAAAKRLLSHLESYGKDITRMSYQAETAVIDSMLSEWHAEANLQEAIVLLELTEWTEALQDSNTQFGELYVTRIAETAATKKPSFSSLRTDAKKAYRAFIHRIEAFVVLNINEAYTQLQREIYELTKQYNQLVKARKNT
ncbi:DUF6261 family protein [Kordia algicida OT-1]|uniref:Hemagglutinin protein HagB n=1 Tax=Kordia algicida OT-1 TaxID=391587 RepID=A9DYN9_9FLAO|nr:DUF6261 family protein [Kordia algicida]EDP96158.1 hemagglutinin protein HagB [Kordia algicida OT-1]